MTSGPSEASEGCAETDPGSYRAALEGLDIDVDEVVGYREEVYHPALVKPEWAEGELRVGPDGRLIKDQLLPEREVSEIGSRFITLRDAPNGEGNLLPIPREIASMLDTMRQVLMRDADGIDQHFMPDYRASATGWVIDLYPREDSAIASMTVSGCGRSLRTFEVRHTDGLRRIITLRREQ